MSGETIFCIGHKSPDTDSVASAVGMAFYLNQIGRDAVACTAGTMNRESRYIFDLFAVDEPMVLTDATGKKLWLVDHSEYAQAVSGAEKAEIVGMTDHHAVGDISAAERYFDSNAANCTNVYHLITERGITVSKEIAAVLLAGILSDTENLTKRSVTQEDRDACTALQKTAGVDDCAALYGEMLRAKLDFGGLTDEEVFYRDYKEYERDGFRYGIACVDVMRSAEIDAAFERLRRMMRRVYDGNLLDLLMLKVSGADGSCSAVTYIGKEAEQCRALMQTAFEGMCRFSGETMLFSPSISRKRGMAPRIDEALKKERNF